MARKSDVFGISKFEIGAPGDGVMGSTLTEFSDIKEGSATLTLPQSDTVKIFSETARKTPYRVITSGATEGPKLQLEMLGIDLADWNGFFGGSYDVSTKKWTFPTSVTDIYKSVRLTTKATDAAGTVLVFEMPYALLTGGIDNTLTFNDLTPIKVTLEAMLPVAADGTEGDVLTVQQV